MRRSNCASALQYVPELTWILFLRILGAQESRDKEKAEVVNLKVELKGRKKDKTTTQKKLAVLKAQVREKDKAARDLENQADAIEAAVFDLKAVNPHAVVQVDQRTPVQIIQSIQQQGQILAEALARLHGLLLDPQ